MLYVTLTIYRKKKKKYLKQLTRKNNQGVLLLDITSLTKL